MRMVGCRPWPHIGIRRCCNSMSSRKSKTNPAVGITGSSKTKRHLTLQTSTSTVASKGLVQESSSIDRRWGTTCHREAEILILLTLLIYQGPNLAHWTGIDKRATAGSGWCCSDHSNRDATQRSSECGFQWPFWSFSKVNVKTPNLSFSVLFLD